TISLLDVAKQLRRDIFAKEVQTSPTYSYQWVADQAGHVALGLLAVLIVWWIIGSAWVGFATAAIRITGVGPYDYVQARPDLQPHFNAERDRQDLRNNVWAAIWYVVTGAAIALSALQSWTPLLILAFLSAIIVPAFHWLRQKIRFQQAGLPFLFRLPDFKFEG